MGDTYVAAMDDRGRLIVPAQLREHCGLKAGQPLFFIEAAHGLLVMTRTQLRDLVRSHLEGQDLVEALLSDRREESVQEDKP